MAVRVDALAAVMVLMVSLLAVAIGRYSATYLDGDGRHGAFLGRLAATVASVLVLMVAGNLALVVVAWVATSLALHRLLLFYPGRPRAVAAARKKFLAARVGDAALVVAAALLYRDVGTGDLGAVLAAAGAGLSGPAVTAAAVLLAVAAMLKAAQFPTHGWLVEVMETPTPVSALLHAGLLNAGPFLVIRFGEVVRASPEASLLLVVVGGFTALFASAALLTQPAVKVALGYSSAAHMGFMLLVCGLGVYPAAVLHLVAHSFYKAHAFLASGTVVDVARTRGVPLPPRRPTVGTVAVAMLAAAGLYLGVASALGLTPWESPSLLAVGAIIVLGVTQLLAPATEAAAVPVVARVGAMAVAVTLAFFGLEELTRRLLGPAVPEVGATPPVVLTAGVMVLAAFAGMILLQVRGLPGSRALVVHLRNGLYGSAVFDRLIGALRRPS